MPEPTVGLVLSIFPGIDLFGRAFEEEGFCVVRGPDLLWGGDIKTFHPPAGKFDGVIGGPPCKLFSKGQVESIRTTPLPPNLIPEFERVVKEANPLWFLMENVPRAPIPLIPSYRSKSFLLDNRWVGQEQTRKRRFTFGISSFAPHIQDDLLPYLDVALFEHPNKEGCAVASEGAKGFRPKSFRSPYTPRRPWPRFCELFGISELELSGFTLKAKYEAVGNAVPIPMGRAIARAVKRAIGDL